MYNRMYNYVYNYMYNHMYNYTYNYMYIHIKYDHNFIWRFHEVPKVRVPEIVRVMNDGFMIETHGDLGIPHFKKPPDGHDSLVIAGSCQLLGDENSRNKNCEQSKCSQKHVMKNRKIPYVLPAKISSGVIFSGSISAPPSQGHPKVPPWSKTVNPLTIQANSGTHGTILGTLGIAILGCVSTVEKPHSSIGSIGLVK